MEAEGQATRKSSLREDRHPLVDGPSIGSEPARGTGCRRQLSLPLWCAPGRYKKADGKATLLDK